MGKDSEYYKKKHTEQMTKYKILAESLPVFAQKYLKEKENLNLQPSTLIAYSRDLNTFFEFVKVHFNDYKKIKPKDMDISLLEKLTYDDFVAYQSYLRFNINGTKHSNNAVAITRKLAPLRGLFAFYIEHGDISNNPTVLVKKQKTTEDKDIIYLDKSDVNKLFKLVVDGNEQLTDMQKVYCKKTKLRDLAILKLLLGTGIRVSECVGLDLDDIDFERNTISIVRKGGSSDTLGFSNDVANALNEYIESERKSRKPNDEASAALFLSLKENRISVSAVERLVKKFAKIVRPGKKITPHKLRSSFGTALFEKTRNIKLVAGVLGHNDISTSSKFYSALKQKSKEETGHNFKW